MPLSKDFMWGGAIAACQVEGAWDEGGRGPAVPDVGTYKPHLSNTEYAAHHIFSREGVLKALADPDSTYYPKRRGIDFYHRWEEDLDLFAELGFKTLRMSISWSRLFPTGEEEAPNQEGIDFYRKVLTRLNELGIEPLVTLSHYDPPVNLALKYNGWIDRRLIGFFEHFATTCFNEFGDLVRWWISFNEIDGITRHPFVSGAIFDDEVEGDLDSALFTALHHQFVAAAKVTKQLHDRFPQSKMGCMITALTTYPRTCHPDDVAATDEKMRLLYHCTDAMAAGEYSPLVIAQLRRKGTEILQEPGDQEILKAGTVDFISFSYYMSMTESVDPNAERTPGNTILGVKNPYLPTSEWGWQIDPVGLRISLLNLYDKYRLPLFIVENGLGMHDTLNEDGTVHDPYRIDYFRDHFKQMIQAVDEGVELLGYTSWSPIDCISNSTCQISKRYGFIYVDQNDLGEGTGDRFRKDSFYWYKKVIASNGSDLE